MYIARHNELSQEFYYAHPKTKIWINNVYNTSLYGAPLWDMSSRNFKKLEKTWKWLLYCFQRLRTAIIRLFSWSWHVNMTKKLIMLRVKTRNYKCTVHVENCKIKQTNVIEFQSRGSFVTMHTSFSLQWHHYAATFYACILCQILSQNAMRLARMFERIHAIYL